MAQNTVRAWEEIRIAKTDAGWTFCKAEKPARPGDAAPIYSRGNFKAKTFDDAVAMIKEHFDLG